MQIIINIFNKSIIYIGLYTILIFTIYNIIIYMTSLSYRIYMYMSIIILIPTNIFTNSPSEIATTILCIIRYMIMLFNNNIYRYISNKVLRGYRFSNYMNKVSLIVLVFNTGLVLSIAIGYSIISNSKMINILGIRLGYRYINSNKMYKITLRLGYRFINTNKMIPTHNHIAP
jgi:hypothetical protein